ncbi:hypothetical protein KRX51_00395 [Corynebacterium sp. TAE3-ERU12]|uniref:hypothetical protein n=1 Tax=Corynebacterium sp. TAE3-ERU12 TaxID=2849491 RepID=UPI001C48B3E5|nr:hypothetical protein [Corynebacterium sp. TAE3-ERU12]MBV7294383.1 hypothetical protein [Corynebacterium sp. TAE3-ERU12]
MSNTESIPTTTVTVPPNSDEQWRDNFFETTGTCEDGHIVQFVDGNQVIEERGCVELSRNPLFEAIADGDWLTVGLLSVALLAVLIALIAAVVFLVRFIRRGK